MFPQSRSVSRNVWSATLAVASLALLVSAASTAEIRNHTVWKDTQGNLIDCHEGGILRVRDTFYWYGRAYKGNVKGVFGGPGASFRCGLNCYSSTDLVHWNFRGGILSYPASGFLTTGSWHRPRVLYNVLTQKYVLWFFIFPAAAQPSTIVVATADRPTGPFKVLTDENFGQSGDLALFQDRDGQGYVAYDDHMQRSIRVSQLSDDFLKPTSLTTIALQAGRNRCYEGSSMVRYKGKFIIAGSSVAGLDPTDTSYAVADLPLGPYTYKGLMSEQKTWRSQISAFLYLPESDRLVVLCEQWLIGPKGERVPAEQSCQLWLPVTFDPVTGAAKMEHVEKWDPFEKATQVDPDRQQ
jgi:hypothetical protein